MEIWKDVEGYEGSYQISDLGSVKSLGRVIKTAVGPRLVKERIMALGKDRYGYIRINLVNDSGLIRRTVHSLVAQAFIPNPEGKPTVNHKNGVKDDNRVDNLEWATYSENHLHAFSTKLRTSKKGERHGSAKLTEDQAREIKYGCKGLLFREISKIYNIGQPVISEIRKGKAWKHI